MQLAVETYDPAEHSLLDVSSNAPVVIVGAGPVGVRALRLLRDADRNLPVLLYGDEPCDPYNRVRLSGLLAGQHKSSELGLIADLLHDDIPNVNFVRQRVSAIDSDAKTITDAKGNVQPYSALILATGSKPFVPALLATGVAGLFTFRDMADAEKLAARRVHSKQTIVLGAGLLGIEAARAMQRHHTQVTLIDHNPHPMYRQLDERAGAMLADELESRGITLQLGNSLRMLLGTNRVEGVMLRDGTQLPCDTLVVATGIVPNKDLAEQAGLAFGRGVTVDAHMQTSAEDVYAIGECCEFNGDVFGIVAPGFEQAAIAVANITGKGAAPYRTPQLATSLKVLGLSVFSLGNPQPRASQRTYIYSKEGIYRRVTLIGGRIDSINAIGDWPELPALRDLAESRTWISPHKLWRFRKTGLIFGESAAKAVALWPDSAIVCNCNSVSCGELRSAVAAGADTIATLSEKTMAGSSCGSCQPLLAELVDGEPTSQIRAGIKTLTVASIVASVLAIVAWIWTWEYPDSVQLRWRWDDLWRDRLFKQISGFSILGLSILSLIFSLRKRVRRVRWGDFAWWRIAHIGLTVGALVALAVHTGFRFGSNLNLMLMVTFLGLVVAGAVLGMSIAFENRLAPEYSRRLRQIGIWGHVLMAWPLPALLGAHVLKTYYF
ncbi:MAG: FAD-dependent oxidoreductase [Pseudomonadota bacterium]